MSDLTLYRYSINGKPTVIRAAGLRDVKQHVLEAARFECRKATADDVLEFTSDGGKVEDVKANA